MDEHKGCCCDSLLFSDDNRSGYISGHHFQNKPVQYSVVDGLAMFEGCIVLGTVDEMEAKTEEIQRFISDTENSDEPESIFQSSVGVGIGSSLLWSEATLPFTIASNLPNKNRISEAMTEWTEKTGFKFVQRNNSNARQHPDYVSFVKSSGCKSRVGKQGGKQEIGLGSNCSTGNVIHEIGHAVGFWHAHSREDRDDYISIKFQNIIRGREHNFNQRIQDGDDIGTYDYHSIMHYGPKAFSKNDRPTIVPKQPGVQIGQRLGLSEGDVHAVKIMYGLSTGSGGGTGSSQRVRHQQISVEKMFASPDSMNAHVRFVGLGWREINRNSPDGVTNMVLIFSEALVAGFSVKIEADDEFVYQVHMN
ncbi:MAG: M12 family metallopeptidase [Pirellulales bacterium]